MVHHKDARLLPVSAAAGCPLCVLIRDSVLLHNPGTDTKAWFDSGFRESSFDWPVYLRPNIDPLQRAFPQDGGPNSLHLRGFKAIIPISDCRSWTGPVRLFALKGNIK
jgi:hypothetical protein